MTKISRIYDHYGIPKTLRLHMYRVAAIANLIADHWNGPPLDTRLLTRVLLIHDLGNIVKIDPSVISDTDFSECCSYQSFQASRDRFLELFGSDDHAISEAIAVELGYSDAELDLLRRKIFIRNDETVVSNDYNLKIAAYADQRVAPDGVVSLQDRLAEAKERYRDKPGSSMNNPRTDALIGFANEIEDQILHFFSLSSQDINDSNVAHYRQLLEEYEISN